MGSRAPRIPRPSRASGRPPRQTPVGGSTERIDPLTGAPVAGGYSGVQDRFTVPATSIWPCPRDAAQIKLREFVGDEGQSRADAFGKNWLPTSSPNGPRENAASIFNPTLAGLIVTAYSDPGDHIIDPFGGGGTRAVLSAHLGRHYAGVEIRREEAERVAARLTDLGLNDRAVIHCADSTRFDWPHRTADMLITCPPYFDLEVYSSDPGDLSTRSSYEGFLDGISEVIRRSLFGLRSGAFAVWVAGRFRHGKTGELLDFPGDLIRLHRLHGFRLYDVIVYTPANPQALYRQGIFDKTRKTVRVHEEVLVFLAP